ncbi:hypothetical protein [Altibacter sp. HG106]|uniref:hypothetical protein n=1 Tax=Altibacter sp. HG106 TaxID=3023937 RepID=UPI0023508C65|nr:hypothetical protein [Altibacter sp. HG106]MDC7996036.1 hypothetical protein [Altibacter sp. HG106]
MKPIYFLLFFASSLIITSCQQEAKEFIDETDEEETFTATANLTSLLVRTAQNFGGIDDVIDGSDCFSIQLPITVIVNGQEVTVAEASDYDQVTTILDQFPDDVDTVEFVFPITVVLADFTEIVLNNQDEFDALSALCDEGGFLASIGCVDLVYPITFFRFNASSEQTDTVTVTDDLALYQFLTQLQEDEFISIQYPLSLVVNGTTVTVSSNQELETQLANAECTTSGGIDEAEFTTILTAAPWYVGYYFDDLDMTSTFQGHEFTFASDGSAAVMTASETTAGTWQFDVDGDRSYLDFFFGAQTPLNQLNEYWEIVTYSSEEITFRTVSSGDGSIDYLTLSSTPPSGGGDDTELNEFINTLTTDTWFVTLLEDSETDLTCNYLDYTFNFIQNGTATAVTGAATRNGVWRIEREGGVLVLTLNFDSSGSGNPLGDLNDAWEVDSFTMDAIALRDASSGGDDDLLSFGRSLPTSCDSGPDPQELRNILTQGTWFVEQYLDDGDDETNVFSGYDFAFQSDGSVNANNGSENVPGIWAVGIAGEELSFEFDMDSPINDADDDDYRAISYDATTVTFITRDSSGATEDILTFKRN